MVIWLWDSKETEETKVIPKILVYATKYINISFSEIRKTTKGTFLA